MTVEWLWMYKNNWFLVENNKDVIYINQKKCIEFDFSYKKKS